MFDIPWWVWAMATAVLGILVYRWRRAKDPLIKVDDILIKFSEASWVDGLAKDDGIDLTIFRPSPGSTTRLGAFSRDDVHIVYFGHSKHDERPGANYLQISCAGRRGWVNVAINAGRVAMYTVVGNGETSPRNFSATDRDNVQYVCAKIIRSTS